MSQEAVGRLEELLARIKKNAALPRPAGMHAVQAAPAAVDELIDDPGTIEVSSEVVAIEDIDLLEEEIVDITDAEEAPAVEIEVEEEEPPASSRRPKAAASMSEALADAAQQLDAESGREIPLKTPPPESGPQAAPPQGLAAPPVPDLAVDSLEADIASSPRSAAPRPTPEQLGGTVDLEEAEPAELELGEPIPATPAPSRVAAPPGSGRVQAAPRGPEVVARPAVPTAAAASFEGDLSFSPKSFIELLDASLALGG